VQLPFGLIGLPFGGCDFFFTVALHLFGPSFNFGFHTLISSRSFCFQPPDLLL